MFPSIYKNIGFVKSVADGISTIIGLDTVCYGEMVIFSNNMKGVVLSLEKNSASAVILGSDNKIKPGDLVFRSQQLMGVKASGAFLGKIVNPLGINLSNKNNTLIEKKKDKISSFLNLYNIFIILLIKIFKHYYYVMI